MKHSIKRRLLIWLLCALMVGALATALIVYYEARDEANVLFDYQLRQIAQSLPAQLVGPETMPHSGLADDADGVVVQIWKLDGQRLYQSQPDAELPARIVLGFTTAPSMHGDWRIYSALFADDVIQVAQPMSVREALAAAVALRTAMPLLLLLPFFGLLIWVTVGAGLAPLRSLAAAVARRSPEALDPLAEERLPAEVTPLVHEINLLLERVKRAFATQRAFIADAAHELRTPLTAVDLQLQLVERAATLAEARAALAALRIGLSRSQRLVGQLLTLARNEPDASVLVNQALDLHALTQEVVAEYAPLAIAKQIDIALVTDEPVAFVGHGEGMRVAIANLVDNAIRYSAEHGHVTVAVKALAGSVEVRVEDDGPGIPGDERQRVFDRFYRGAGANATGSGLGLAIVARIVEYHHGSITLDSGSGGQGLLATMRLPQALPLPA